MTSDLESLSRQSSPSGLPRRRLVYTIVLIALSVTPTPATAQQPAQPGTPQALDMDDQATVRRMINNIQILVVPQQKEQARQLIENYPGSEVARAAQRLLDEYALFDRLKAAEDTRKAEHEMRIRQYWENRRSPHQYQEPPQLILYNATQLPVLYQLRTDFSEWMGPYHMAVGGEYRSGRSVRVRLITPSGLQTSTLFPGQAYIFQDGSDGNVSVRRRNF